MEIRHERFRIRGEVTGANFVPWIARYGQKLGLECSPAEKHDGALELTVAGQPDLIDAMELGCSLGPWDACVDAVERLPLGPSG